MFRLRHRIEYRTVLLQKPDEIVRYSSALGNSIAYLDLSLREYSNKEKIPFTYDALYKRMEGRATILDKFHLDLPNRLADYIKTDDSSSCTEGDGAFHIIYFIVTHESIVKPFSEALGWSLRNSRDPLNNLTRLLPLIQELQLCQFTHRNSDIFDDYIAVLMDYPQFPWIQNLFLDNCCFHIKFRILNGTEEEIELFLKAAQALNMNLFPGIATNTSLYSEYFHYYTMRMISTSFCPVNYCLYNGRIENVTVLLNYGFTLQKEEALYDSTFLKVVKLLGLRSAHGMVRPSHPVKKRRMLLLYYMIVSFCTITNDLSANFKQVIVPWRKIWRAISDPFLMLEEIKVIFCMFTKDFENHPIYLRIVNAYENYKICDRDSLYDFQPRRLKHLSRIAIRKSLHSRNKLPRGIEKLGNIPIVLKSYLRLYP